MYEIVAAGMHTKQFISSLLSDKSQRPVTATINAEIVAGRSLIIGEYGDESKPNFLDVFLAK